MTINGKWSLIIRGEFINVEEIERNMNLKASRSYKKGQIISETVGENLQDVWIYEVNFNESLSLENALLEVVSQTEASYIKEIKQVYEVVLQCHVVSELAQIRFGLSNYALMKLQESGIDLRFSIFSWGVVE